MIWKHNGISFIVPSSGIIEKEIGPLELEREFLTDIQTIHATGKYPPVVFDLTGVVWADLFPLLSLAVAGDYLRQLGIPRVTFLFRRFTSKARSVPSIGKFVEYINNFYYSLRSWGLMQALQDCGFDVQELVQDKVEPSLPDIDGAQQYQYNGEGVINQKPSENIIRITPIRTPKEFKSAHEYLLTEIERFLTQQGVNGFPSDIADFCHTIVYEICENVHIHSGTSESEAKVGLVGLRYQPPPFEVPKRYQNVPWLNKYFARYLDRGYLDLTVVDSGRGVYKTLGPKRYGDSYKDVPEQTVLKDAFEKQLFPGQESERRGLFSVQEKLKTWKGVVALRSGTSLLAFGYTDKGEFEYASDQGNMVHRHLGGTQLQVIFPAEVERYRRLKHPHQGQQLQISGLSHSVGEPCLFQLEKLHVGGRVFSGDEAEERLLKEISDKMKRLKANQLLLLDFTGTRILKMTAFERVLERLLNHQDTLSGLKRLILVGLNADQLSSLSRMETSQRLREQNIVMAGFDETEQPWFIGPTQQENEILKTLVKERRIESRALVVKEGISQQLIAAIRRYCKMNNAWLWTWQGKHGEVLSCVDFDEMFSKEFSRLFKETMEKSGAIHEKGHFRLPSGLHSNKFVEFRLALSQPTFITSIAKEIAKRVQGQEIDAIFSYSIPGLILSHYVRPLIKAKRYVIGKNYNDLRPVFGEDIRKGEKVLILTDVVGAGGLVKRMRRHVESKNAVSIKIIAVLETEESSSREVDMDFLYEYRFAKYIDHKCPECEKNTPLVEIDPIAASPMIAQEVDPVMQPLQPVGDIPTDTRKPNIVDIPQENSFNPSFWEMIERTESLECGHIQRGTRHYDWYDHTEWVLDDQEALKEIEAHILGFRDSLSENVDVILHPDNMSATVLAHTMANLFSSPPIVICATRGPRPEYFVSDPFVRHLRKNNVFLVDDAVNTGKTLNELFGIASMFGGKVVGAYVLFNRLPNKTYYTLQNLFNGQLGYTYRLRAPIYSEAGCPLCNQEKELKRELSRSRTEPARQFLKNRLRNLEVKQVVEY